MGKQRLKLSEQICWAVDACGLSRYRTSKRLGIAESTLSRFMSSRLPLIDVLMPVRD
jgi:hypothetical protein